MSRRSQRAEFDEIEAARALLAFMSGPRYRPMLQRELLHHAHVAGAERASYGRVLGRLLGEGRIRRLRGGRLIVARPQDQTKARLVERARSRMLGMFERRGSSGVVRPLEPARGESVRIPSAARAGAEPGEVVVVEIAVAAAGGRPADGRVIERLGPLDASGTDLRVVTVRYALAGEFPPDARAEARALGDSVPTAEIARRERFDAPDPVTIDGETARDFDDAIAVAPLAEDGFRLWVHVADVAHYVPFPSALDAEAARRGTSVYFPESVIPMLPEELSNGLCSLVPRLDRLVQTVILDFDESGKQRRARFTSGVIRSAARLTYSQVGALLEGRRRGHGVPAAAVPMLRLADRLRAALERRRHARGSIDFDLPEPQVLLDVEGAMTGIAIAPRNLAHRLIEEFMIAANEAVAEHLARRGVGTIFRVHEAPDPTKLEALVRFVEGFGHRLRAQDPAAVSQEIQRLLESVESRPEERVVHQVALRSMNQARYATDNLGHFALAAPSYCHFTSPIRRYPDLVVHRQLRALDAAGGAAAHDAQSLAHLAETSSRLERNAEAAERELLNWKKVAFIAGRVGESFDGIVTGVTRFGLFVQLVDSLVEGLVRVELLGAEWFDYDERRHELRGAESATAYRLGDRLSVTVTRVDRLALRVDLAPAQAAAGRPPRPRRPRAPRRAGARGAPAVRRRARVL